MHIYKPSFLSFAIFEFQTALFVAALLCFWMKDVAYQRKEKPSEHATRAERLAYRKVGMDKWPLRFLFVFFVLFVVDIMVLYCSIFVHVKSDPSYAKNLNLRVTNLDTNEALRWPIAFTLLLMCGYACWYMFGLCNNLRLLCKLDNTSRMTFFVSQVVQIGFFLAIPFGTYSRHFDNGPI